MRPALASFAAGVVGVVGVVAATAPADAGTDADAPRDRDQVGIYVVLTGGLAGLTGELADDWSVDTGSAGYGVGVRYRGVELTGGIGFSFFDSDDVVRDSSDLWGLSFGGDAAYHVAIARDATAFARLGYRWRRLWSEDAGLVRRDCGRTGECAGGFYIEDISYWANGPTAALGVERTISTGGGAVFGVRFQVEAGAMLAELPGDDLPGVQLGARLDVFFGRTWVKRGRRPRT